jgi:hypothetical protein
MAVVFQVKLNVRQRGDRFSAKCAEVPGLHLYGRTLDELNESARKAIPYLLRHNRGYDVTSIHPTSDVTVLSVVVDSSPRLRSLLLQPPKETPTMKLDMQRLADEAGFGWITQPDDSEEQVDALKVYTDLVLEAAADACQARWANGAQTDEADACAAAIRQMKVGA